MLSHGVTFGSNIVAAPGATLTAETLIKQDVLSNITTSGYVKCGLFGCNDSQTQNTITQRSLIVSGSGDVTIDVAPATSSIAALTCPVSARPLAPPGAAFSMGRAKSAIFWSMTVMAS